MQDPMGIMQDPMALTVCKAHSLKLPKLTGLEISSIDLLDLISQYCPVSPFNFAPFNFWW